MLNSVASILPLLIPVLGLLIGLVVVGSIFVIHPLVGAITKLADAQGENARHGQRLADPELEQRLAALENSLTRLLEDRGLEPLPWGDTDAGTAPVRSDAAARRRTPA